MKKIEINYTTNEQFWTLETVAEATENTTEAPAKAETITAASTRQAWEIAGEILGTDYTEDAASTARAGYPIHRSTAEGNRGYICDLGDRLEVNLQDGSSRNIWISREALADEATADRDRIAEELRELKNKLFHLSLVSA